MHQAAACYPAYQGLGGLGYFGAEEGAAREPIEHWSTRTSSAKTAIAKARAAAQNAGNMATWAALEPAALAANIAAAKIQYGREHQWTGVLEQTVAFQLSEARKAFDAAQGLGATTSPRVVFPMAFPTWTLAAATLPAGAPGKLDPGVLPPGEAPKPSGNGATDQPPVLMGAIPWWGWLLMAAVGGSFFMAAFRR